MNWKKWAGLTLGTVLLAVSGARADLIGAPISSSYTITSVQVSTFNFSQMDVPVLSGRTQIEIQNLNPTTTDYFYCVQASSNPGTITFPTSGTPWIPNSRIIPGQLNGVPGTWTLNLGNFATNRGAYPTSTAMDIYCASASKSQSFITGADTATVTQSY